MKLLKAAVPTLLLCCATALQAAPITMAFSADNFTNAGTQYPGFDGPVNGVLAWDAASTADPITAFTSVSVSIPGHTFGLADVAIASNSGTRTAFGALPKGANAVVGDGAANDFLMVFDRVNPAIDSFAYSIEGKTGAIWWTPATSSAQYVAPTIYTLDFYVNGFVNAGTQYPGYSGPLNGSVSWLADTAFGPMTQLVDFNLSLFGKQFGLVDVGLGGQSGNTTALGALPRGANAVVGDGLYDDFLMVIDRTAPAITSFAFSLSGKNGAIWWTPSESSAQYVIKDVAEAPEPASLTLFGVALAGLVLMQRKQRIPGT